MRQPCASRADIGTFEKDAMAASYDMADIAMVNRKSDRTEGEVTSRIQNLSRLTAASVDACTYVVVSEEMISKMESISPLLTPEDLERARRIWMYYDRDSFYNKQKIQTTTSYRLQQTGEEGAQPVIIDELSRRDLLDLGFKTEMVSGDLCSIAHHEQIINHIQAGNTIQIRGDLLYFRTSNWTMHPDARYGHFLRGWRPPPPNYRRAPGHPWLRLTPQSSEWCLNRRTIPNLS